MKNNVVTDDLLVATLESTAGLRLQVLNLGATVHALEVPTKQGVVNVVLAY